MIRERAPSRLLPVPAPPHDPYSVMLAGHNGATPAIGWRARRLFQVDIDRCTRALVLAPAPSSARWLSEPSGSFGGLRTPSNVALTSSGDVLLLDAATGVLRRFDPCTCRFVRLPCVSSLGEIQSDELLERDPGRLAVPRDELLDPRGIAVCGGDVFIADRGHHRVVRYALGTWVPRGLVQLPRAQRLALGAKPWSPCGLVTDSEGRLIVSDPVHGRIDRFTAAGRWIDVLTTEIGVTHLAVDCADRIYFVVGHNFVRSVPGSAMVTTLEIDAGMEGLQWHTLRLSPMAPDTRLSVDVHAGDEPWSPGHLADPANSQWARWLDPENLRHAIEPQSLGGRTGRFLRLRFTPAPGHVAASFVVNAAGARVHRVTGSGIELVRDARADRVVGFGRPPLSVDQAGRIALSCEEGVRTFDLHGELVADSAFAGDRFEREGDYFCRAIDSRIEACQWHSIELRGSIPRGCSIEVRAMTAEIELSDEEADSMPPSAWSLCGTTSSMEQHSRPFAAAGWWDALITARPGRFLWLQCVLRGDGRGTPTMTAAVLAYPRISLRRYLPSIFGVDPAGADFTDRFSAIFDRTLRSIEGHLDRLPMYFDPLSAPAEAASGRDFLSWLGDWIGVALAREWPTERRRRFVKEVARLYRRRGTPEGLRRQLLLLLGFDVAYGEECLAERPKRRCVDRPRNCNPCPPCKPAEPPPLVLEHFKLRRWLYVGKGRLGSDAELWGKQLVGRSELSDGTSPNPGGAQNDVTRLDMVPDPLRDPFFRFAHKFSVFVPARVRDNVFERRALEQLIARESPAHTQADIRYVEPRFRVGVQASIGLDSVIARTPRGVTLDVSRLRRGSVLSGRARGPHLEVGTTRVGTTTRLT